MPIVDREEIENGPSAIPGPGNWEARIITPIIESINQSSPKPARNLNSCFTIQAAR
jgi:hypothetical protein